MVANLDATGLVGTSFEEGGESQFFRRECFEAVGGYVPIRGGGIDWLAVTTARMKGWMTRTFLGKNLLSPQEDGHCWPWPAHCPLPTRTRGLLRGWPPALGVPPWRVSDARKTLCLGGLFLIGGYFWAWANRMESPIPTAVQAFQRREQMKRLWELLREASLLKTHREKICS